MPLSKIVTRLAAASVLCTAASQAAAVAIVYDFEGDTSQATDKAVGDGAQNGVLLNKVSIEGGPTALFGNDSARFQIPAPAAVNPPFSTFEVGGSTQLGEDFSLAMHLENLGAPDFTRLFSSFRGTGPVGADRLLLDYDPSGTVIPGIRAIVNNTVVSTAAPPVGVLAPGYHHVALTVDSGDVKVYFDGVQVAAGNVGLGYSNTANLHVGEDPHDGGGAANEQLIGNVDDVLVLNRTLSAVEIADIAVQSVTSVVTPGGEYAAFYDFEGDIGPTITDKFVADGSHDGSALENATVSGASRFGSSAGSLQPASGPGSQFSQIEVGTLGDLGHAFTLSASFNQSDPGFAQGGLTRLFSTFGGTGSSAGRLILDFDHEAGVSSIAIRLILPDGTVAHSSVPFSINQRHTITATYDNGDVRVYLDGLEVASATTTGNVDLGAFPLLIGEDIDGMVNENFLGLLDDVLILSEPIGSLLNPALNAAQVMILHQQGVAGLLQNGGQIPTPAPLLLLLTLILFKRRLADRKSYPLVR